MTATINGVPIHYVDTGSPSEMPVIFVHGFPFSHEMWKGQLEVVSKVHRALAYDIRGHGQSFVGDGQYTIEGHVEDLIGLLDHLAISRTVIVGLSMGGYITLRALERNPERFLAAVLCDTRSEADTNEGKIKRAQSMKSVKENGSEAFADEFVKAIFAPETFGTNPDAVAMIQTVIARTPPLSIAGTLLALASRTDTTPGLPDIHIPALILVGEFDSITPLSSARVLHQAIPGSDLHVIPSAAHMSNIENPDVFNEQLLIFLRKVSQQLQ